MNRRGATLMEVLVAIFVMAIGMMALLVLFPIGALSMAQAIQDERCAQAAANAGNIATLKNIRNDKDVLLQTFPQTPTPAWLPAGQDIFNVDLDGAGATFLAPDPEGPSNVVLVDPAGYLSAIAGTASQNWVASKVGFIPRRSPSGTASSLVTSSADALRWFSMLDEY